MFLYCRNNVLLQAHLYTCCSKARINKLFILFRRMYTAAALSFKRKVVGRNESNACNTVEAAYYDHFGTRAF